LMFEFVNLFRISIFGFRILLLEENGAFLACP
jgi:hypothetical protein